MRQLIQGYTWQVPDKKFLNCETRYAVKKITEAIPSKVRK